MSDITKNIALIELGNSHFECLYSQIRFLKCHKYTVHLICKAIHKDRVESYDVVDHFYYIETDESSPKVWLELFRLRRYILSNKIHKVVLNTATNRLIRNLMWLPFSNTEFTAVMHHTKNMFQGFRQQMVNRKIMKYFVLNDYLLGNFIHDMSMLVQSFYPIFFQPREHISINKPAHEFWICIPGQVESKRRDYTGLLREIYNNQLSKNIKLIVLGRGNHSDGIGEEAKQYATEAGMESQFVFFEEFVDPALFQAYIQSSDIIMPLIHPSFEQFTDHFKYQISSAYNVAFAYHIPMLIHELYEEYEDFAATSFFYGKTNMIETMNDLAQNPDVVARKSDEIKHYNKFKFEVQAKKYIITIEA